MLCVVLTGPAAVARFHSVFVYTPMHEASCYSSSLLSLCVHEQLPENTIGKALRLLHERLSSKISDGVVSNELESNGVTSDATISNGLHSSGVSLGCDGLGLSPVNGVESNGILVNSSV